ncbi:hypothetical protein LT330_006827 [Penicillium expansum]|nr:hypothetical protein LT330_006827 [Penicillium expansum]
MAGAVHLSIFVALGALQWEPCWPSETDWANLNSSIHGNLISVRPIGRICHEPTYEQQACDVLLNVSRNSGWRAAQPGTLQDWVWESGSTREETCFVGGPVDLPCHQGRTPLYSAAVRLVSHVQCAIKFAKNHNLRLVIRNTGHDGSGRSSAPGSFEIHTHHLKHTHYHDDFQPVGAVTTSGPAVTVGAGVILGDLYAEGARQGYTVVGGVCPTVGFVGGFLQGGGVSGKFSHSRGLAVDNVLEIQAVTADGDLVVANDYHNQDLFWALRGGGGGTFAVVTQATVRVFPDVPCVTTQLAVSAPQGLDDHSWMQVLELLLRGLRSFNEERIAGEFHLRPDPLSAILTLHFLNTSDLDSVDRRLAALIDKFRTSEIPHSYSSKSHALEVPRSVEAKLYASHELTSVQMPVLYSLDPSYKVSYLNMGDPNDADFRNVYWGPNYERLLALKQKWDVDALKQDGLWGRIF